MSLYNALFGVNPHAPMLLGFLGITPGDVPRFRDCYAEGGRIVIHTRTGGGNRAWYDNAECYREETGEDGEGPWNDDLRALPGFVRDEDGDFDSTYANFYYEPPEDVAKLVSQLGEIGGDNPSERWQRLFGAMREGRDNPQVARALEVCKPIIEALTASLPPASVGRSPEGGDGEAGSIGDESAVGASRDAQPQSGDLS